MPVSTIQNASLASGVPSAAKLPAGSVLQVVQTVSFTQQATTSGSYVDITNFSVSITPTSATSKILTIVNVNGIYANQRITGVQTSLARGSTGIAFGDCYAGYQDAAGDQCIGSVVMQILDSPATTSSTTYKVQFRSRTSGSVVIVNINDAPNIQINDNATNSCITLMEIAA